jgi:S-adenosylmethionine uptake transporter
VGALFNTVIFDIPNKPEPVGLGRVAATLMPRARIGDGPLDRAATASKAFCVNMKSHPVLLPFAAACAGIALFSAMDAAMKGLSIEIGAYNAMLWRLMAGAIMGGIAFVMIRGKWPTQDVMRLHIRRGVTAAFMAVSFFWGITRVPLAEGIALSFIAPLITLYLAALLLKETISRGSIIASIMGIVGVLVILAGRVGGGTSSDDTLLGIAAILFSAVLYAYNLILQRQQALVASPIEVAFFQSIIAFSVLALAAPKFAVVPQTEHIPLILLSAGLAFISLLLLSWAYARAEAQVLVPVEYTAFPWAVLMGWVFFNEPVTFSTIAGTALIVTGCIIAARQKTSAALIS